MRNISGVFLLLLKNERKLFSKSQQQQSPSFFPDILSYGVIKLEAQQFYQQQKTAVG